MERDVLRKHSTSTFDLAALLRVFWKCSAQQKKKTLINNPLRRKKERQQMCRGLIRSFSRCIFQCLLFTHPQVQHITQRCPACKLRCIEENKWNNNPLSDEQRDLPGSKHFCLVASVLLLNAIHLFKELLYASSYLVKTHFLVLSVRGQHQQDQQENAEHLPGQ